MKPLADHGTTARAKGRPRQGIKGCGCRPCLDAQNTYNKRRRVLNETGRPVMVPAEPARKHLRGLFAGGGGWLQISAATRTSQSTLWELLNKDRADIPRRVANRILATRAEDVAVPNPNIPAAGSIRRCRALIAIGHEYQDLIDESNLGLKTIQVLVAGRVDAISERSAAAVSRAYAVLSKRSGSSNRARSRAAREGWHGPMAWDEDTIDDPQAEPETGESAGRMSPAELAAYREQEALWLASYGVSSEEIAKRLGVSPKYMRERLRSATADLCTRDDCARRQYAKGLCHACYERAANARRSAVRTLLSTTT